MAVRICQPVLNALVVQWIRIGDYGSSDKRSNRFESTNKVLWPSGSGSGLQNLLQQFESARDLNKGVESLTYG